MKVLAQTAGMDNSIAKPDGIYLAHTDEEKALIYSLRYQTYIGELERYLDVADHGEETFYEEIDEVSRQVYMVRDGKVVGAMRHTWGGDAEFSTQHVMQYQLGEFLAEVQPQEIVIGERFFVVPECRGSDVLLRMFEWYMSFVNEHRIQLVFGDCEPHLLNLYMGLGFRPYSKTNYNSPDVGYLILLVILAEDVDYLQFIGSPMGNALKDFGADARIPQVAEEKTSRAGTQSQKFSLADDYWSGVFGELEKLSPSDIDPFSGMTEDQRARCLERGSILECNAGDVLILKGNTANHMYVVLNGVVEVRDGADVLALFTPGDLFGEMAFLLGMPRTQDVFAATDEVRVLALSEAQIRLIMKEDPEIAAHLLLNISRMLCLRLLKASENA